MSLYVLYVSISYVCNRDLSQQSTLTAWVASEFTLLTHRKCSCLTLIRFDLVQLVGLGLCPLDLIRFALCALSPCVIKGGTSLASLCWARSVTGHTIQHSVPHLCMCKGGTSLFSLRSGRLAHSVLGHCVCVCVSVWMCVCVCVCMCVWIDHGA